MGIAMLWIMLFHAYDLSLPNPVLDFIKRFGYLGVDIFLFLSGLGLAVSLCRRERDAEARRLHGYFMFLKARLFRVFPAYWLMILPYSLFLFLRGRIPLSTLLWNCTGLHYWVQAPGGFNWYISALLAFYLLAPCWHRVLRRCGHREWLTALLFPLSYALYRLSIVAGFLYTRDFVFRIPAFALGMLIGYRIDEGRSSVCLPLWICTAAASAALSWGVGTGKLYIGPCFIFALAVLPLCLALACLLRLLPRGNPASALLSAIGQSSLEIYLINVIVTRELACSWRSPVLFYLLLWAANLAAGLLLHRILTKAAARAKRQRPAI